jgi:hypothetical protein
LRTPNRSMAVGVRGRTVSIISRHANALVHARHSMVKSARVKLFKAVPAVPRCSFVLQGQARYMFRARVAFVRPGSSGTARHVRPVFLMGAAALQPRAVSQRLPGLIIAGMCVRAPGEHAHLAVRTGCVAMARHVRAVHWTAGRAPVCRIADVRRIRA